MQTEVAERGTPTTEMAGVAATHPGGALIAAARLAWEFSTAWAGLDRLEKQRRRFSNEDAGQYDEVDFYSGEQAMVS